MPAAMARAAQTARAKEDQVFGQDPARAAQTGQRTVLQDEDRICRGGEDEEQRRQRAAQFGQPGCDVGGQQDEAGGHRCAGGGGDDVAADDEASPAGPGGGQETDQDVAEVERAERGQQRGHRQQGVAAADGFGTEPPGRQEPVQAPRAAATTELAARIRPLRSSTPGPGPGPLAGRIRSRNRTRGAPSLTRTSPLPLGTVLGRPARVPAPRSTPGQRRRMRPAGGAGRAPQPPPRRRTRREGERSAPAASLENQSSAPCRPVPPWRPDGGTRTSHTAPGQRPGAAECRAETWTNRARKTRIGTEPTPKQISPPPKRRPPRAGGAG